MKNDKRNKVIQIEWVVHRRVHDGIHTFSSRALKIIWEATTTLQTALYVIFLAICFVSDDDASNRALRQVENHCIAWASCFQITNLYGV